MEEILNNLVVIENGALTAPEKVDAFLDQFYDYKKKAEEFEKQFRAAALEAMLNSSTLSVKTDKYVISQVVPKDTVIFDTERFNAEADPFIVDEYTSYKKENKFDIDALLADNPDLVAKYTKAVMVPTVDLKKLEKNEPEIYNQFVTIIPSEKAVTLRIAENKK